MNKSDFTSAIAAKAGLSKRNAEDMLEAFIDIVIETLKSGEEVTLTGFGTFSAKERAAREGVNPQDPSKKIHIPATTVAKFKAGSRLKNSLKEG